MTAVSDGAAGGAGEEEAETAGVVASGEVLEQMLQVCEQDMNAADGAVAELRRGRVLVGKRRREEAMAAAEAEAAEVFAAEAEVAAVEK